MTDAPNRPSTERTLDRQNRLREALRENLKRRKSQSRGRADQPALVSADDPGVVQDEIGKDSDDKS
ncbi:MAG: hypothetical protein HXX15_14150 [Rhodopseudomonas sp.]|uniref:hypothetical protein n=1 Tax=Rhodopseudomonas sp. TaxID=1078 RepID=UPI0017E32335|nr:hypothetical protein [Rhodopseudomonas sp.]NVN87218.1 hypothetical protein [Rhodopseudomonas sp.]